MKKLFGMICYRYVYAIPGEIGDETYDGVVLNNFVNLYAFTCVFRNDYWDLKEILLC